VSTKAQASKRLDFVDSLRGLAVVFMVPLHTSHGWVRPEARHGDIWNATQFFGGLAAPIFLTLAGVSLGLQWAIADARGRRPLATKNIARGLQLVVLGYLMRLQMWVIDGAGYADSRTYLAQGSLLAAYGLAYYALSLVATRAKQAAMLGAAASVLFVLGLYLVRMVLPERARSLLRIDVLQCIGASLVVLSAIAAARGPRFAQTTPYLIAALVVALLTGWVRSWVPGPLPDAVAGYLAQWAPPAGRPIIGLFPLFPWLAYALFGAALGLSWGRAENIERIETSTIALVAAGATVALLSSESWPPIYELLRDQAWLTQPIRVAYRLGLVLALLGVALAARRHSAQASPAPLEVLGRASLLIYWVHLEFAFGAAAHPLVRQLDLAGWGWRSLLLLLAMWLLAYARVAWPRLRFPARNIATS
jgi:uncharacterized membrane protein